MPPAIDFSTAVLIAGGLVTAIIALWRRIHVQERDFTKRIRALEDGRLEDERRHSREVRELAGEVLEAVHAQTIASSQMAASVRELAHSVSAQTDLLRRRAIDSQPQTAPQTATDAITRRGQSHV